MFPRCLSGQKQVEMISAKNACEQDKEKTKHHEGHPDRLNVPDHCFIFLGFMREMVTIACNSEAHHLEPRLEEQEEPKSSMV